jgi:serine/threonine protein kinase/tetratricopeptide (TPR) repeat protein
MARVLRICRKCGTAILVDEPEGLCAACVLETSLGMLRDEFNGLGGTEMPEELGDYQLLEEIGRGGQGLVYRARQKSLNRIVALKVIGLGRWATKAHIKRFRLEAEAAASLDHPCIVPIHEIGESDGSCYFSMKLVEGQRLDEVVKRESMPNRRAAELIIKLARTVHYAHKRGILHRDIKPGNILVDADGEPHLTDFGLARLVERESTITGTMIEALGTPSYMAPEQAAGDAAELTSATDVYGLGAVFYHLLTGHPPLVGGTMYETVRLVLETEPPRPRLLNPNVDRDLSTICLKCLEKDPERRYSSALALAEDLECWLKHEPIKARRAGILTRGKKWVRRNPATVLSVVSLLTLAGTLGVIVWKSELLRSPAPTGIAVLPFENLSNDRDDASFVDGLQDDVLTKLAKLAELKVISHASVMQYRPAAERNMRQIGDALRVSHVLTGSVRKTGAWLHINAQLIDTRTDTHVWAEQYDRDLKDVFTIQSEIAQKVAEQLHVKISPAERLAIQRPPTADLTAFDLYSRAKILVLQTNFTASATPNFLQAINLLNQAVGHDPMFLQAYCQLADVHEQLYFFDIDRTPARLALAEEAIQAAYRLRPDAGEAHLARAENLYMGYLDYDGALVELETASQSLPNDPKVFELKGYIERRQGKQDDALQDLEHAADLDPRNVLTLQQLALSNELLRRYAKAGLVWDRVLTIQPNDAETKAVRALVELNWKADTRPLHQLIDSIRVGDSAALSSAGDAWLICALAERDAAAAQNAVIAMGDTPLRDGTVQFNRPFIEGIIARLTNDEGKAWIAFTAARSEQEKIIQAQPDYGPPLCVLGLIDAALGRKGDALREGRRAVELLPVEKDALNGQRMIKYLAMIAAWVGDKDIACNQLAIAMRLPSHVSYGQLKLLPFWDPLRGDPRFERIVASLAPK